MQNAICPTVIDEATVMDSVRMDEESVTYYYTLDEELVDMQLLWENREEMHSAIVDELKVAYAQRITSMYKYKISTKYVYIGNQTQRIVKVVVTPDEYL